jgi:hypothetical protein
MDKLKLSVMEAFYRSKNVATITAEYSGAGDDGGLESDPCFQDKNGKDITEKISAERSGKNETSRQKAEVAYDILNELIAEEMDKHDGFEINDGGGGQITIDLTSEMKVVHDAYYMELVRREFSISEREPDEEEVP